MKKAEELIETKESFKIEMIDTLKHGIKKMYNDMRNDFYDERKSKQIAITLGSLAVGLFVKNYI